MIKLTPNESIIDGKYRLLSKLGEGGMAAVWSAMCTTPSHLPEEIVLKILLPEIRKDLEKRKFFVEEARLSTQLSHPLIVRVFQVEQWKELDVLIMERVWGQGLDTLIKKVYQEEQDQVIPWPIALRITAMIAEALHYANTTTDRHGQRLNVIHRDIKPGNVMFASDGQVKVIDFGIAKASISEIKTQTGIVKGTIAYMSPEQLKGEELDIRSDLFSLGILLFELCTGKRPFYGENFTALMINLLTKPPTDPLDYREDLPEPVRALILRLLDKDKTKRPITAKDLQHLLEEILQTTGQQGSSKALEHYFEMNFPELVEERSKRDEMLVQTNPETLTAQLRLQIQAPVRGSTLDLGSIEEAGPHLLPTGEVIEGTKPIMRHSSAPHEPVPETEFIASPHTPEPFVSPILRPTAELPPPKQDESSTAERLQQSSSSLTNVPEPLPQTNDSLELQAMPNPNRAYLLIGLIILLLGGSAVILFALPSPQTNTQLANPQQRPTKRQPKRVTISKKPAKSITSKPKKPLLRQKTPRKKRTQVRVVARKMSRAERRARARLARAKKRAKRIRAKKRVKLARLGRSRRKTLEKGWAAIRITPSCIVSYKGKSLGNAKRTITFHASPGKHKLKCVSRRHKFTYHFRITIKAGKMTHFKRSLRKVRVSFLSNRFSRVFLKLPGSAHKSLGATPVHPKLYEGRYRVIIINGQRGSLRKYQTLNVRPGKKIRIKAVW